LFGRGENARTCLGVVKMHGSTALIWYDDNLTFFHSIQLQPWGRTWNFAPCDRNSLNLMRLHVKTHHTAHKNGAIHMFSARVSSIAGNQWVTAAKQSNFHRRVSHVGPGDS